MLRYLDKFVDLSDASHAEESSRERLLTLQTDIEKAEQQVQLIPQYERALETTRQQLTALRKPEVKDLIDLQRQLATERELRTQIAAKIEEVKESLEHASVKGAISEIRTFAEPAQLSVGADEFRAILDGASTFENSVGAAEAQVKMGLTAFEAVVTEQAASWRHKDTEAQKRVDAKRRELEALKVSFDMSYIAKLTKDEARQDQSIKSLKTWKTRLAELRRQRATALKERWEARERVATLRDAFARQATDTLREALSDLSVSLKYARNAHSPDAADQIVQAMGWRTNQQPRAAWLVEDLTVPELLRAIERNNAQPIVDLQTPEGTAVFSRDEAKLIIEKLSVPAIKFALERVTLHDLPRLHVTKAVPDGSGGTRHIVREFSKLSLGQQQSVLLALILSSNSNRPRSLTSRRTTWMGNSSTQRLFPVLRRAKERRQVIIVTHNPNVAVLGDADLIVVMKALSDRGEIVTRGSIDDTTTRDAACAILEGAKEAFLRRGKTYGIRLREP